MPDMTLIETRVEAKLLEIDRRLYLYEATLKYLRPKATPGMETTATRTVNWFLAYGDDSGEDIEIIFKDADTEGDLEAALEGVEFVEMLDVKYKVQRIDRPKPGQARVYFIHTTIKKFVKRGFKIP